MDEKTTERKVVKWARDRGWLAWKLSSPGTSGVPDRMFISPHGRITFIEFKAPGKTPTALQNKQLKELHYRFVKATWVDNAEEGIEWLNMVEGG